MTITRRHFLASSAISPILLGLQDKAGSKLPVVGEGSQTYEVTHDWGTLPPSLRWGNTHGVIEDADGNIHIHHTVHATSEIPDTMVVFDRSGKFIRSWGKELRGVAHGLHLQREGSQEFLYLTANSVAPNAAARPEIQGAVVKATLRGEIVWRIDGPPDIAQYRPAPQPEAAPPAAGRRGGGGMPRYNPTNVAIAPNGDVYVADGYGFYYINQYDSRGQYIRTFGGRGSEPGQMLEPHGIWMDTRGPSPTLVVADRRNNRLQRFTLDGRHIDFVSGFRLPCHFHERQGLVVIPDLHGRVTLINRQNQVVVHLGDSNAPNWSNPLRSGPRENFVPGQFVQPHGACFDRDGNIFVVEWVEVGRVSKLRKVA